MRSKVEMNNSHKSLEIVGVIPTNLTCSICKYLLYDLLQSFDGYVLCKQCVIENSDENQTAPIMSDSGLMSIGNVYYFPDNWKKKEINNLLCYCKNREKGCQWMGAILDLSIHCIEKCEYETTICELCTEVLHDKKMYNSRLIDESFTNIHLFKLLEQFKELKKTTKKQQKVINEVSVKSITSIEDNKNKEMKIYKKKSKNK